jgi:hypothetical protein
MSQESPGFLCEWSAAKFTQPWGVSKIPLKSEVDSMLWQMIFCLCLSMLISE